MFLSIQAHVLISCTLPWDIYRFGPPFGRLGNHLDKTLHPNIIKHLVVVVVVVVEE